MQVFRTYFKILKKHRLPIIIYAVLFLAITVAISVNYLNEKEKEYSNKKVPVLVINHDGKNELTDGFLDYLGNYVIYEKVKNSESARKDALFYRKVKYILTIPKGFTKDTMSGKKISMLKETVPDSTDSYSIDSAIDNYFNTARNYIKYSNGITQKELVTKINSTMQENTKVIIDKFRSARSKSADEFNASYYNYLAYIIIAVFIIAVSTVMLTFNNINIRRKHQASPISNKKVNLQLVFANVIFTFCYLLIFFVAGFICNPYRSVDQNMVLYWINAGLFALTALSISYLVGITVNSKNTVTAISTAVSLGMAFISGAFVPQDRLGNSVLKVASFTPAYWYVRVNKAIGNLNGYHFSDLSKILGSMAIQIGFAAAFLSITLVVSKKKSQQVV